MNPPYAELHCLSNFSFQRGASHPEELVTQAAAFGYAAIALTDECSFAGIVRAHRALQALPAADRPRLIIGSELQLADGPRIVLLATNRIGYGQLSRLITQARRAAGKGEYRLTRDMIDSLPGVDGHLGCVRPVAVCRGFDAQIGGGGYLRGLCRRCAASALDHRPRQPVFPLGGATAGRGDEARELAVAGTIGGEQHDARAVLQLQLAADDQPGAVACGQGLQRAVGAHDAGERAFVGERDRGVAECGRLRDQLLGVRGAALEAEVA